MRPIWKGHLTFGLITIPMKLYTATDTKDIRFRLLHKTCLTPIQNKRYCPKHEQIVDWNDVVRGFEYAKGKFVTLSDEDLEKIPLETAGTVAVTGFVNLSEIDPIYFQRSYYLAPDEGGQKAFRLIHDAMGEMGRVAMGKVVIKEKEHLVAVRPYDGALVMNTLFYADEIRAVDDIPEFPIQTKVLPNEMKMAMELIQGLAASFAPQEYKDDYRAALKKLIDAKIEGEELVPPVKEERKVVDLMDALKRSLEMAQRPARGRRSRAASHPRTAAMRERHR